MLLDCLLLENNYYLNLLMKEILVELKKINQRLDNLENKPSTVTISEGKTEHCMWDGIAPMTPMWMVCPCRQCTGNRGTMYTYYTTPTTFC